MMVGHCQAGRVNAQSVANAWQLGAAPPLLPAASHYSSRCTHIPKPCMHITLGSPAHVASAQLHLICMHQLS